MPVGFKSGRFGQGSKRTLRGEEAAFVVTSLSYGAPCFRQPFLNPAYSRRASFRLVEKQAILPQAGMRFGKPFLIPLKGALGAVETAYPLAELMKRVLQFP